MKYLLSIFLCVVSLNAQNFTGEVITIPLTNIVLQITPHPTNQTFFVLDRRTNMVINGTIALTPYVGTTIKLSWDSLPNVVYGIEYSTNETNWSFMQIKFVGDGKKFVYYDQPAPTKHYRLWTLIGRPKNLKFNSN